MWIIVLKVIVGVVFGLFILFRLLVVWIGIKIIFWIFCCLCVIVFGISGSIEMLVNGVGMLLLVFVL